MVAPQPEPPALPGYRHVYRGKVRDLYEDDAGALLFVASDRISAFDHVLPTTIPDKGRILTALSLWWFDLLADLVPNHVLSVDVPAQVSGRAMICERLDMYPVECVARGYLTGSGLTEYTRSGTVCAVPLPPGLVDGSALPQPVFTPATKAPLGEHDQNVDFDRVVSTVGEPAAQRLREVTLAVYERAAQVAAGRGIVLADTKLEFGRRADLAGTDPAVRPPGLVVLADEVLTPDSSRFWPADQWHPGRPQQSYDKQYVRDWLTSAESGWDRSSGQPPPPLPDDVVARTRAGYVQAYEQLTGRTFT